MALNQATNITPSLSGAFSLGNGVADVSHDLEITWQVNGQSAMTAYQVTIYENDASSTQKYTTGKVVLDEPFYGKDALGNFVFFRFSVPAEDLAEAEIVNGGNYKLSIRQWWGETDAESITQSSAAAFITRKEPNFSINEIPAVVASRNYTFTANYSQEQGDALNCVRWQIAEADDKGNPIYDSQNIYTALLSCTYDGFFSGKNPLNKNYAIRCRIQTVSGVEADTGWVEFTVYYTASQITGLVKAKCLRGLGAVEISWPNITFIPGTASGAYEIKDGMLRLPEGSSVTWNSVNGEPMSFSPPFYTIWKGNISTVGEDEQDVFTVTQADAPSIVLYADRVRHKIGLKTTDGHEIGTPLDLPTIPEFVEVICILTPTQVYWRISFEKNGLYPAEAQYPAETLYPNPSEIETARKAESAGLYITYHRWDKRKKATVYHWKKYSVNVTHTDTNLGTTGTKLYSHILTPETLVLNSTPQIEVIDGEPKYDFSAGRQTVVQTDYTPVGSFCAANNDSIKTEIGGVGIYHSYYAKVLSISDNTIFGWVESSNANAEIHGIQTTRSRGTYIGVAESESASAYPQDGISGDYWYVYQDYEVLPREHIEYVRDTDMNAYPKNGVQGDYWYIYKGEEYERTAVRYEQSAIISAQLDGAQVSDYFGTMMGEPDDSVIREAWQEGTYRPAFTEHTQMLATFTATLEAGLAAESGATNIDGYIVYRQRGNKRLVRIGSFPLWTQSIIDFTIRNQQGPYKWSIYPKAGSEFATDAIESEEVNLCFWDWSLISCRETAESGYCIVDAVYRFKYNVGSSAMSNNNEPAVYKNFTAYPTVMSAPQNYKSGTLTGLIGVVTQEDGQVKYSDTIALRDAIMRLSVSRGRLFLRNRKGDLLEVRITGAISMETMDNAVSQAQTASITWTEVADAADVSLISFRVPGEEDEG